MTSRTDISRRMFTVGLIGTTALALAGCSGFSQSRLNPRNWFGGSKKEETVPAAAPPGDPRPLVDQVTELKIDRLPGGAIVTAVGLPATQGWWDTELVKDGDPKDGVLTYRFVLAPPPFQTRSSTPRSREVSAGAYLSDIQLEDIRKIVVVGERNSRSTSR